MPNRVDPVGKDGKGRSGAPVTGVQVAHRDGGRVHERPGGHQSGTRAGHRRARRSHTRHR